MHRTADDTVSRADHHPRWVRQLHRHHAPRLSVPRRPDVLAAIRWQLQSQRVLPVDDLRSLARLSLWAVGQLDGDSGLYGVPEWWPSNNDLAGGHVARLAIQADHHRHLSPLRRNSSRHHHGVR